MKELIQLIQKECKPLKMLRFKAYLLIFDKIGGKTVKITLTAKGAYFACQVQNANAKALTPRRGQTPEKIVATINNEFPKPKQ